MKFVMKITICGLIFFGALLLGHHNARAANWPDSRLDAIAASVAGHPVQVYCEDSWLPWNLFWAQYGSDGTYVDGFTYPTGAPELWVSPSICFDLHLALERGAYAVGSYHFALAIHTLNHEAVHQRGITDEGVTDCTALALDAASMVNVWHVPATITQTYLVKVVKRVRGHRVTTHQPRFRTVQNPFLLDALSWDTAQHKARPAAYQGTC
jgi:hypothetical protein